MRHLTSALLGAATIGMAACSVSTGDSASDTTEPPATTGPAPTTGAAATPPPSSASAPSTDGTTAPGTTPTTSSPEPTTTTSSVPVRGVTPDSIKLGIAPIDADAVREQFGVDLGHLPDGTFDAFAQAVNAAGGINGRRVEIAVRPFLPVGTESSEAACRELIEDEQVYAVSGLFLGDNGLCVTETYATPYFALFGLTAERQARSAAPFLSMEGDALGATTQAVIDSGALDGRRVAVFSDSAMAEADVAAHIVEPARAAGLDVVSVAQLPASGDLVQAASDIDLIFQRFQADGADAIVVAAGASVFLPALERTDWEPQLVFTNGQFTGDGGLDGFGLTDYSELDGSIAVSMSLLSDDLAADPLMQECLDTVNEYTGSDYTITDIYPAELQPESREIGMLPGACQLWAMTTTVLEQAGDRLAPDALTAALDDVGTFAVPGYAAADLSSTDWGAVDTVRVWTFDVAQQRFVPQND